MLCHTPHLPLVYTVICNVLKLAVCPTCVFSFFPAISSKHPQTRRAWLRTSNDFFFNPRWRCCFLNLRFVRAWILSVVCRVRWKYWKCDSQTLYTVVRNNTASANAALAQELKVYGSFRVLAKVFARYLVVAFASVSMKNVLKYCSYRPFGIEFDGTQTHFASVAPRCLLLW